MEDMLWIEDIVPAAPFLTISKIDIASFVYLYIVIVGRKAFFAFSSV
jgi:hypothetical protein